MLAGLRGADHPFLADARWQGDIHGIDVPALEQLLVAAAGNGGGGEGDVSLAFVDEAMGAVVVATGHGDQDGVPRVADRLPVLARDVRGSQDAPATERM